jgi:two-component system chemotaxis response regulator CheY
MHVLIVDDAPDIRLILTVALTDVGYQVASAANGQEALVLLRDAAERPCVIVLDLMMPIMDGWTFLAEQQADEALAAIPVIILTAAPTTLEAAQARGARAVLQKLCESALPAGTMDYSAVADRPPTRRRLSYSAFGRGMQK